MFRSMSSEEQPPRHLERRWATRYSFRAELEIEWGSAVLRGKTRDISANGMFIESADTLWVGAGFTARLALDRSEEHTSELQSRQYLVCRLLLEKNKTVFQSTRSVH